MPTASRGKGEFGLERASGVRGDGDGGRDSPASPSPGRGKGDGVWADGSKTADTQAPDGLDQCKGIRGDGGTVK